MQGPGEIQMRKYVQIMVFWGKLSFSSFILVEKTYTELGEGKGEGKGRGKGKGTRLLM